MTCAPRYAAVSATKRCEQIAAIWTMRADRYSELRTRATGRTQKVEMSLAAPPGPARDP